MAATALTLAVLLLASPSWWTPSSAAAAAGGRRALQEHQQQQGFAWERQQTQVNVTYPALFPESVVWAKHANGASGRFLVSSVGNPTVFQVDPFTNVTSPWAHLPASAVSAGAGSTVGLHLDRHRNRLLVAVAATVQAFFLPGAYAGVAAFDISTGAVQWALDLRPALAAAGLAGGLHGPNDVTALPDGTVFVTDTLAGLVFRVASDGSTGEVWFSDPIIQDNPSYIPFGANGIEYDIAEHAFLLLNYGSGSFFRICALTKQVTKVGVHMSDSTTLQQPDGTVILPGGLLLVTCPIGEVHLFSSRDGWSTAREVARGLMDPSRVITASALVGPGGGASLLRHEEGASVWGVNCHFDEVAAGDLSRTEFGITRIDLKPV